MPAIYQGPAAPKAQPVPRGTSPNHGIGRRFQRRFISTVLPFVFPLIFPLLLLALWQWAANHGLIAEQILPAPAVVFGSFKELLRSGELWQHLLGSLTRVSKAYGIAAVTGVLLGMVLGLSRRIAAFVVPTFEVYAQTPVIAWIPIGMMLFGISETLAVVLIGIAAVVPVVMNTYKGVSNLSLHYLEVARIYRLGYWKTLSTIVMPAAFPQIFVGLRYGLTQAWLTLVAAELIGIDEGLGAFIVQSRNLFQIDNVLVAILTLGLVGLALDKGFILIERRVLCWRKAGF